MGSVHRPRNTARLAPRLFLQPTASNPSIRSLAASVRADLKQNAADLEDRLDATHLPPVPESSRNVLGEVPSAHMLNRLSQVPERPPDHETNLQGDTDILTTNASQQPSKGMETSDISEIANEVFRDDQLSEESEHITTSAVSDDIGVTEPTSADIPTINHNHGPTHFDYGSTGILGDVYHNYYSYATPSLFGGLQAAIADNHDVMSLRYRRGRASLQVSSIETMLQPYTPHAVVSSSELKAALIKVAGICQFLDAAAAEYFRAAICHLPGTKIELERIRGQILVRQSNDIQYIGSLGRYCERIVARLVDGDDSRDHRYQALDAGDNILPYLQDGFEVPYWEMMADHFVVSKDINNNFSYELALSVINDKRREIKLRMQQARRKWDADLPQHITDGIDRRIRVLDELLARFDKYDSLEEQQVQALQRSPTSGLDADSCTGSATIPSAKVIVPGNTTDLEKVNSLSLFLVFTGAAALPCGIGLHSYLTAEHPDTAIGSTSDPDFKLLIASFLLAFLGNIYAAVPLWKITRGSTENSISQALLLSSFVLGMSSICVYPFWNKAWSGGMSFLCSYFAIGSVFVSARRTSNTATEAPGAGTKAKKE